MQTVTLRAEGAAIVAGVHAVEGARLEAGNLILIAFARRLLAPAGAIFGGRTRCSGAEAG